MRGNAEWFVKVFSDIRLRYPAYQIAIFKVTAPAESSVCEFEYTAGHSRKRRPACSRFSQEEVIRKRVAERAKQTGRSIPESMLVASIGAVERLGLCVSQNR